MAAGVSSRSPAHQSPWGQTWGGAAAAVSAPMQAAAGGGSFGGPGGSDLAEMMEADARIIGRLAEAVSRLGVVARPVADGQTMTETRTAEDIAPAVVVIAEAEGAQEVPGAEGGRMAREEEIAPRMRVMTVGEEVAAPVPASRKF